MSDSSFCKSVDESIYIQLCALRDNAEVLGDVILYPRFYFRVINSKYHKQKTINSNIAGDGI